jgi:hypothetical protein
MGLAPGIVASLLVLLGTDPPASPASKAVEVNLRGRFVTLASALRSLGIDARPDPASVAGEVVLLGDDGSITPLFRDDASRAVFLDERLRDRKAEVHGRRFPGVPYLQVATFQVERDGRLQTPGYFCEVCSITVGYPQVCPCCQGPMELRMKDDRR